MVNFRIQKASATPFRLPLCLTLVLHSRIPDFSRRFFKSFGLSARHHFQKEALEVFGFGNCWQNWMIERLFEASKPAC